MKYLQMNFEIATFSDIESSFINRWMLFQKSEAESAFAGTPFALSPFARVSSICNVVDLQVQTACIRTIPVFREISFVLIIVHIFIHCTVNEQEHGPLK